MVPHELAPRELLLPATTDHSIVLFTADMGSQLPYERFALRMQQEFGTQVVAWFRYQRKPDHPGRESRAVRIRRFLRQELKAARAAPMTVLSWPAEAVRMARERLLGASPLVAAQHRLFGEEVAQLRQFGRLESIPVENPNSPEFIARLKTLSPYFFLSLGGPLFSPALLSTVRGIALNQHAGWSPDYRGANTTWWALYHRDLNCVGTTVHQTTTGADAGPVFRRSQACLLGDDDAQACFTRVVALGTELMCETVHDIMANKRQIVFEQPRTEGRTYLADEMDRATRRWVNNDLANGWITKELQRLRRF
jgi:methionyl-tRNA formyltransferase